MVDPNAAGYRPNPSSGSFSLFAARSDRGQRPAPHQPGGAVPGARVGAALRASRRCPPRRAARQRTCATCPYRRSFIPTLRLGGARLRRHVADRCGRVRRRAGELVGGCIESLGTAGGVGIPGAACNCGALPLQPPASRLPWGATRPRSLVGRPATSTGRPSASGRTTRNGRAAGRVWRRPCSWRRRHRPGWDGPLSRRSEPKPAASSHAGLGLCGSDHVAVRSCQPLERRHVADELGDVDVHSVDILRWPMTEVVSAGLVDMIAPQWTDQQCGSLERAERLVAVPSVRCRRVRARVRRRGRAAGAAVSRVRRAIRGRGPTGCSGSRAVGRTGGRG